MPAECRHASYAAPGSAAGSLQVRCLVGLSHALEGRIKEAERIWIARALGLSPETVKRYLSRIYAKLQVSGRDEAVARMRDLGS